MTGTLPLPPRRILVTHAGSDAFAPHTRTLLSRIGYSILSEGEFAETGRGRIGDPPDLRLVDERRLGEIPEAENVPMVVLTGKHGTTGADPRIAGALKRPAGLHETYRLVQQILEDTPRTAPRVATHVPVQLLMRQGECQGAILSLSENGCLVRSPAPLPLGSRVDTSFRLGEHDFQVQAETSYQLLPDTGLVFAGLTVEQRERIAAFVERVLATT